MSKRYNIRWTDADDREIKRVLRNFKAKNRYLLKNHPDIYKKNNLPQFDLTVSQIKELITNRRDLNKLLNMLKRFSKRGAEKLVKAPESEHNIELTKWQIIEQKRMGNLVNYFRNERLENIKNLEMVSRGEGLGYTRGQFAMGKPLDRKLEPIQAFTRSMHYGDAHRKFMSLLIQSQHDYFLKTDYIMKANYLTGLRENYRWDDIKALYEYIEDMDISEFLTTAEQHPGLFEEVSPPTWKRFQNQRESEYESYVDALYSTWLPKKQTKQ